MTIEPAELTPEKLTTEEGVRELNRVLRELSQEGRRITLPYGDATARSADTYLKTVGDGVFMSATKGYRMHRKGSVVGHSTILDITTATSGDVTFELRVNDANQSSLENEFTSALGVVTTGASKTAARHSISFDVGDLIQVFANETGVMAWDNVIGIIEIEFDE